jgi:hypothetical protein
MTLPVTCRTKMRFIRYHQDRHGGWLEAPRQELERLGLADTTSSESHAMGDEVYLTEDSDGAAYLTALVDEGTRYRLCPIRLDFDHPIRSMPRYFPAPGRRAA